MASETQQTEASPGTGTDRLAIDGGTPVRVRPFGPRWVFTDADREQLAAVMDRADVAWRNGEKIREFTGKFQTLFGVRNAIATGSGTAAIHGALGALNPEPGDEIITTPSTDIGTVIGVLQHNLIPVFADWAEGSFNTCPADIERRITKRTRAILVVHLFGFPCDMAAIMDISRRHGIPVIEDCAQAHLAEFDGQKVGSFGQFATYSFGLKTLTTDQGGMLAAGDADDAAAARGFLSKGSIKKDGVWTPYARLGTYAPMSDLQAAIGVEQIDRLDDATQRRQTVARKLDEAFADIDAVTIPPSRPGDRNVYYLYPYHLDEQRAGFSLEQFISALKAEGISDAFGPYLKGRALHHHPLFLNGLTYGQSGFPLRDEHGLPRIDYRAVKLPVIDKYMPGLGFFHMRNSFTEEDGRDMAAAIRKVARGLGAKSPAVPVAPVKQAPGATPPAHAKPVPEKSAAAQAVTSAEPAPAAFAKPTPPPAPTAPAVVTPITQPAQSDPAFEIDFQAAGGRSGGGKDTATQNSATLSGLLDDIGEQGAVIRFAPGNFLFNGPIDLTRSRNLRLTGQGGNANGQGTCLTSARGPALRLRTTVHCQFDRMEFRTLDSSDCVVDIGCDEAGPDGVSSLALEFSDCSFHSPPASVAVLMRDCATIDFRRCWFTGQGDAVALGVHKRPDASSVSNGLANSIQFDSCIFFRPIRGVRASAIRLVNCLFSTGHQTGGVGFDAGASPEDEVANVTFDTCFALEADGGTFFRQGQKGAGLTVLNSRFRGYDRVVELDGHGGAVIQSNLFEACADSVSKPDGLETCSIVANISRD